MKRENESSASVETMEIKLRNKFAAKIPEELHGRFIQEIRGFISLTEDEAMTELWKMAYVPEYAFRRFGFTVATSNNDTAKEGEAPEKLTVIPKDWTSDFRNELHCQYTKAHKGFPTTTYPIPEECEEAFKALKNAEGSDVVIATICFDACYGYVEAGYEECIEKSIRLLNDPEERFYCGGIRSIGFKWDETTFLKPYAIRLADIVEALYESWKKKQAKNCPMSGLGQLLKEKGFELTEQEESSTTNRQEATDEVQLNQESASISEERSAAAEAQHEEEQPKQQPTDITLKTIGILEGTDVLEEFISLYKQKEEASNRLEEAQRKYDQTCQQLSGVIAQLSQMGFKMKEEDIHTKAKAISMILQGIAIMKN